MTASSALDSRRATAVSIAALSAAWALCGLGLLWIPMDLYDEPALALGSRIVRAGGLPYISFYTHYGPLGYQLLAPFLAVGNPAIAYRLAQTATLALIAIPMILLARRLARGMAAALLPALLLLNFSAAIVYPHFLAYGFLLLGLELAALAQIDGFRRERQALWLLAGAAAAIAGLIRPVFGFYTLAALTGALLALEGFRSLATIARFVASAAGSAALLWALLYRHISLTDAWFAMVVIPAKITSAARFQPASILPPRFPAFLQRTIGALHLTVVFLLATLSVLRAKHRPARFTALFGATAAGAAMPLLPFVPLPGRAAAGTAFLLLLLAMAALFLARQDVAPDSTARISAVLGLAAVLSLHYYLGRSDQAHLMPSLALAAAAAVVSLPALGRSMRAVGFALLAVGVLPLVITIVPYPPYWIGRRPPAAFVSTARGFWARFPASAFPQSAVQAVEDSDRRSSANSRFVALSTDQSRTEGSAIVLFLLSRRLPYTRWYAYDPGAQSTPFLQSEMIRELEHSGSATAVTWASEAFGGEPAGAVARTPLDRRFRELYPRLVEEIGSFAVWERAGGPEPSVPTHPAR